MTMRSDLPATKYDNDDLFQTFRREIDKFVDDFWRHKRTIGSIIPLKGDFVSPYMDVLENDKEIQITAELPGLEAKDIKVEFNNGLLTINGSTKREKEEKDSNYYITERSRGFYHRSIQIPSAIDEDKIEATVKNGVLTVILPKSKTESKDTKKIEVKKG